MDTKALRQKVLDLAIRGKLVPQDPNDEPASVLLERIRQQKQQMVKDGKLKAKDIKNDTIIFVGEDNLHYEKFADGSVKCIEDEIPFDLPDSWAWSRIGPLCEYITSGSRGWAQYYSDTGSLFLRMGNLSRDSFELRLDNLQRVNLPDNAEGVRTRVVENDLLFSITAEIGMLGLIPADFEEAYINQHVGLIRFLKAAQTKYFPYILMSNFCRNQYYIVQSGMKNSFRLDNIQNILAPVPPLIEQIRIAEKLSSIWAQIQQIDVESVEASDLIAQAKSKILDLAIRGQLVPQDPADEPASVLLERIWAEKEEHIQQGKIKRDKKESVIFRVEDNSYYLNDGTSTIDISEELPFDIPDSWCWGRLKDIVMINPRNKLDDDTMVAFIPMPLIEDGYSGRHTSEVRKWKEVKTGFTHFQEGDVGVAKITPCFENRKSAIFENLCNGFGAGTTELHVFRPYNGTILPQYLLAYMKSAQFVENGKQTFSGAVGQQRLSKEYVENAYFPIPPMEEQKRIVHQLGIVFKHLNSISDSLS